MQIWSVHVLPVPVWDSSGHSGSPPQPEDLLIIFSCDSNLSLGASVFVWFYLCQPCNGLVTQYQLEYASTPHEPNKDSATIEDGWMSEWRLTKTNKT